MGLKEDLEERLLQTSRVQTLRRNGKILQDSGIALRNTIISRADKACKGYAILPGTGGQLFSIGTLPKWYVNPTNDQEFLWALNRMEWWTDLLRGFLVTGESAYVEPVISQFENWVQECSLPDFVPANFDGCSPWRSLEVGLRMAVSWPPVLEYLAGTEFWNDSLIDLYSSSARDHARVLLHMCPTRWPDANHNHYLTEMAGLLTIALLFPELDTKNAWRETAYSEIVRCIRNQITTEGGHIEGCPGYHNHCVDRLLVVKTLLEDFGSSLPVESLDRLKQAVAYTGHASRPTGTIVPWGDSDPNYSHISVLLRAEQVGPDSASLAKAALNSVPPKRIENVFAERIEDISWEVASRYATRKNDEVPPSVNALSIQNTLKQLSFRSDWSGNGLHLFFGCMSPVHHGGHAHMDPMSFELSCAGAVLLSDPGRYTYREGADRKEFKSATAHNTVTVNEEEPFFYRSSFEYGKQGFATMGPVVRTSYGLRFSAWQTNFMPVLHQRTIHIIKNVLVIIFDQFLRDAQDSATPFSSAQLYFHSPGTSGELRHSRPGVVQYSHENLVLDIRKLDHSSEIDATILPGRISTQIDLVEPSQRLRCSMVPTNNSLDVLSIIAPRVPGRDIPTVELTSMDYFPAITCRFSNITHIIQLTSGGFP